MQEDGAQTLCRLYLQFRLCETLTFGNEIFEMSFVSVTLMFRGTLNIGHRRNMSINQESATVSKQVHLSLHFTALPY